MNSEWEVIVTDSAGALINWRRGKHLQLRRSIQVGQPDSLWSRRQFSIFGENSNVNWVYGIGQQV